MNSKYHSPEGGSSTVLIVAPHADDEVLGCGATIAKHVSLGDQVYVVILTNASRGAPELYKPTDIDVVRSEATQAHKILGVSNTIFLDFPAPALDCFPSYKISNALGKIINEISPELVFLPHPGDLHNDHGISYKAGLVAARPINGCSVRTILCYETLSETEWAPMQGQQHFSPNYFVESTDFMELKIRAIGCYKSQMKEFPNSRSTKAIKHLAAYRGSSISVPAAEAFELERQIVY